jgi:hypothetical protein
VGEQEEDEVREEAEEGQSDSHECGRLRQEVDELRVAVLVLTLVR